MVNEWDLYERMTRWSARGKKMKEGEGGSRICLFEVVC